MIRWWRLLPFRRQAFIIITAAICVAIALLEFFIEPIMENNIIPVVGGIDWHEAPMWLFVAFLVGFGVAAIFTRSVMLRLSRLTDATEEIVRGNLAFRIPTQGNANDVFGKLSGRFNFMAETIEELLSNERRLLSDISHELRSPLARISATVDVLLLKNRDNDNTTYLKKGRRRTRAYEFSCRRASRAEQEPPGNAG